MAKVSFVSWNVLVATGDVVDATFAAVIAVVVDLVVVVVHSAALDPVRRGKLQTNLLKTDV